MKLDDVSLLAQFTEMLGDSAWEVRRGMFRGKETKEDINRGSSEDKKVRVTLQEAGQE